MSQLVRYLDAMYGHVLLWIRGCQHPKSEPDGTFVTDVNGEKITLYLETCTVCGITLIHEV